MLPGGSLGEQPAQYDDHQRESREPCDGDSDRRSAAHRAPIGEHLARPGATLRHHRGRDEPDGQGDPCRHDEQVIEIPEHGDEVGDQVDGTERVGGHSRHQQPGKPRRLRVMRRQIERQGVALEAFRLLCQSPEYPEPLPYWWCGSA